MEKGLQVAIGPQGIRKAVLDLDMLELNTEVGLEVDPSSRASCVGN